MQVCIVQSANILTVDQLTEKAYVGYQGLNGPKTVLVNLGYNGDSHKENGGAYALLALGGSHTNTFMNSNMGSKKELIERKIGVHGTFHIFDTRNELWQWAIDK